MEQQQQCELASATQQSEARLSEVEADLSARVKAVSHLLDHTAKAGSQVMTHVAQLEATSKADIAGALSLLLFLCCDELLKQACLTRLTISWSPRMPGLRFQQ